MKIEVKDENFKSEVLESKIPVLVDFWAEWCMPCKTIAPTVDELALEYDGKIKVCSINVDDARDTAANYQIMSIPTLAIFKNGEVIEKIVGVMAKDAIISKLISPNL